MDQSLKYELLDSLPEQVRNVSPEELLVEYDRESDTLMLLLDFERTRGVSIRVAQDLYLRVAPDRETLLGLQLEHFVALRQARARKPRYSGCCSGHWIE